MMNRRLFFSALAAPAAALPKVATEPPKAQLAFRADPACAVCGALLNPYWSRDYKETVVV